MQLLEILLLTGDSSTVAEYSEMDSNLISAKTLLPRYISNATLEQA
jgi:hypothetical protein